jgi:opacity protein-like surface antigen
MNSLKKITLISLLTSSLLVAETKETYLNMSHSWLSHSWLSHSDNGTVSDFNPTGFKWTIGQELTSIKGIDIAVEPTVMLGVTHDKKASVASATTGTFSNASIALDKLYNVNLRVQKEVLKDLSLQAYLGVSRAKMIALAINNTPNQTYENALTYGAGISYEFLPDVSVNLEYMQYFKNLSAVELGLGLGFAV